MKALCKNILFVFFAISPLGCAELLDIPEIPDVNQMKEDLRDEIMEEMDKKFDQVEDQVTGATLVLVNKLDEINSYESVDIDTDGETDGSTDIVTFDCDDSNPNIHPGAPDVCDGIDNDCDGQVDEDCDPYAGLCSIKMEFHGWGVITVRDSYGEPLFKVAEDVGIDKLVDVKVSGTVHVSPDFNGTVEFEVHDQASYASEDYSFEVNVLDPEKCRILLGKNISTGFMTKVGSETLTGSFTLIEHNPSLED